MRRLDVNAETAASSGDRFASDPSRCTAWRRVNDEVHRISLNKPGATTCVNKTSRVTLS